MINDKGEALLADFGISRLDDKFFCSMDSIVQYGNCRWLARELLVGLGDKIPKPRPNERGAPPDEEYTRATSWSDMWSFGMTFIEVLSEKHPFAQLCFDIRVLWEIIEHKLPTRPTSRDLSDELWELVERCWDITPERRPSANDMKTQIETSLSRLHQPPNLTFTLLHPQSAPELLENAASVSSIR